jgi:hypothetical protein
MSFREAQRRKEVALAGLREFELNRMQEKFVDIEYCAQAFEKLSRALAAVVLRIPNFMIAEVATCNDERRRLYALGHKLRDELLRQLAGVTELTCEWKPCADCQKKIDEAENRG